MRSANRCRTLFWLLSAIFAVFLFWCLAGITIIPSPQTPLEKLKQAQSLWNKQNISNYRMTIFFVRSFGSIERFTFSIENNKVVKIENADTYRGNFLPLETV